MMNRASGTSPDHEPRGIDEVPVSLVRNQSSHVADDRRVMRQPERLVHADDRRGEDVLDVDPLVTVTVRSSGTPSATTMRRMASDAHTKQSTWRCFHRERVALQMEIDSARRDKRWRRRRCSSESASDAMATPCGSCA